MTRSRSTSVRLALTLPLAALAWLSAYSLWQLHDRLGPQRQRINVRFADDVSVEARREFEQQRGLVAGEDRGTRTWTYVLSNQSAANIGALVQSPLVEDTAHIDRTRLRVVIDQPGVQPWLRELLERGWLPHVAWLLTMAGVALAWTVRRGVWGLARAAVLAVPRGLATLDHRLETLSAPREAAIGFALCALFLTPLLLFGPTDDEEAGLGLFSSQIYYRELLHGRWSYWFTGLGFGTPMPIGQRLDFHPVFALGSLISLRAALSGLWIVQLLVMAVYFRRLLAACGLAAGPRLLILALYLFSVASFLLFYDTDWVSCAVPWTLYPVVVYYLRDAVMGGADTRWWLTTVRLAVVLSLWVLNAHPGYLVPLFIVLAVYTLAAARPTLAVYGAIATAGMFALTASAERIYFLVHERGLFPPESVRLAQAGYSLRDYLVAQATPLTPFPDMRQPLAGAFVFGAAVAAPFWWRRFDRHVRACIVAFVAAVAMSLVPLKEVIWTGLSGVWLFRDPMLFFGLLSAAAVVQSALHTSGRTVRAMVVALLALQCLQQVSVISHGFRAYSENNSRLEFYRYQGRPSGIGAALAQAASRHGRRLYLSVGAYAQSRGHLSHAGVHVVTDYALLGLNPVTVLFKNVSMDRIHPSWALMVGYIGGQQAVIDNPTLLDVLGINLVAGTTNERLSPEGLIRVPQEGADAAAGLDIFANPDAWPTAVLLSPNSRDAVLPVVEGCGHTAAMCRDYTALAATRLPQDVSVRDAGDGYVVHVPPADAPRLLFVSAFHRPEWVATAGDRELAIEPIAGAFLGVTVPPGVQDIELAFRPRTRIALTWLSGVALVGLLVALGAITWRGRARRTGAG